MKYKVRISLDTESYFEEHFTDRSSATMAARTYLRDGWMQQDGKSFVIWPPSRIVLLEVIPDAEAG